MLCGAEVQGETLIWAWSRCKKKKKNPGLPVNIIFCLQGGQREEGDHGRVVQRRT